MSQITLKGKGGATVKLDDDQQPFACRGCGAKIFWATTKSGKGMPVCKDKDGAWISHFSNCPRANTFRKDKKDEDRQTTSAEHKEPQGC